MVESHKSIHIHLVRTQTLPEGKQSFCLLLSLSVRQLVAASSSLQLCSASPEAVDVPGSFFTPVFKHLKQKPWNINTYFKLRHHENFAANVSKGQINLYSLYTLLFMLSHIFLLQPHKTLDLFALIFSGGFNASCTQTLTNPKRKRRSTPPALITTTHISMLLGKT